MARCFARACSASLILGLVWGVPASATMPGDVNCDSVVNFDDIDPFVLALSGPAAYEAAFPDCEWRNADCNGDDTVNFDDIDPFVALLQTPTGACCMGLQSNPPYEPWECIGDVPEVHCLGIGEDTFWVEGESCSNPGFSCCEYCIPGSEDGQDERIVQVILGAIDNPSDWGDGGYEDYTDLSTVLIPGTSVPFQVVNGTHYGNDFLDIWIDTNDDCDFDDEGELVYSAPEPDDGITTGSFIVPAVGVATRIRFSIRYESSDPTPDPCALLSYGEFEDYAVIIDGNIRGACCDLFTGVCTDNVAAADCALPSQFFIEMLCDDLEPACGNAGACCDPFTGTCTDDVLELNCQPPRVHYGGEHCDELNPVCGNPGCCCVDSASEIPFEELELNCAGRFLSGVFGTDCATDAFNPSCGTAPQIDTTVGTAAPPDTLFDCMNVIPFPTDSRPLLQDVSTLPWPCEFGGEMAFDSPVKHLRSGTVWPDWGHGYTGDVYYTNGETEITLILPEIASGIYFYVAPYPYALHTFKVVIDGWYESEEFTAHGSVGAAYCGILHPGMSTVKVICTSGESFAIGEFGACCEYGTMRGACCDLEGGECRDNMEATDCLDLYECPQFVFETLCADLDPPCGNPGACCDPFTGVCTDGVTELYCLPPAEHHGSQSCADLDPICGNPGCCCVGSVSEIPFEEFELACADRFLPGVVGTACVTEAFVPACGTPAPLIDTSVGMDPPPAELFCCGIVTPFPDDPRPTIQDVTTIDWPCPTGGELVFSAPFSHRRIGDGWLNWSHGYTGDVYYSNGATQVTLTCTAITPGLYFYVEPNVYEFHTFKVIIDGWYESQEFTVHGFAGAAYCGVYCEGLSSLTVVCTSGADFAIGEFGACCAPCPPNMFTSPCASPGP